MDAVREAVHALTGVLTIQSQVGTGSRFILRLPMTVSIIHALMVECGPFEIAFPLSVVTRTMEVKRSEIKEEPGRSSIILEDASLTLRSLRQALHLPDTFETEDTLLSAVICDVGGTPVAYGVDRIIGQKEIFVRPLRSPLSHLRGIGGATITGDGRVLFIADVLALQ